MTYQQVALSQLGEGRGHSEEALSKQVWCAQKGPGVPIGGQKCFAYHQTLWGCGVFVEYFLIKVECAITGEGSLVLGIHP